MICFNSGDKDTQIFENCAICKILHVKRQLFLAHVSLLFSENYFCRYIIKFDYGTPNYSK